MEFSPNGTILVTGGMDRTVRLWDVATGREIGDPLDGHSADVTGVAFDPGGSTMVSWGRDGTARVWNIEATVDPVRSLCRWAKGAFTADRWRDNVPPGPAPAHSARHPDGRAPGRARCLPAGSARSTAPDRRTRRLLRRRPGAAHTSAAIQPSRTPVERDQRRPAAVRSADEPPE